MSSYRSFQMADTSFVYETTDSRNKQAILLGIVLALVVVGIFIDSSNIFENNTPQSIKAAYAHVSSEITQLSPVGMFYISFFGGFFFVPDALELGFVLSLAKGNSPWVSLALIILGFIPSQIINYILGTRFGSFLIHFVSKRELFKTKRWVNKYGSYAIFFVNMLPLPSPLLTFALGITRYNVTRLFFFMILGSIVKYCLLIWLFSLGIISAIEGWL